MIASRVLEFIPDVVLARKGDFKLDISTRKDTTKDKNINTSSLKLDFKNLKHFLLLTNRSTMQQKLFQNFVITSAGVSGIT